MTGWISDNSEDGCKETEFLIGPVVQTCISLVNNCGTAEEKELLVPKLEKFDHVEFKTHAEILHSRFRFI
jgi:hypothetical protein